MTKKKVPSFESIHDMAHFWNKHDSTEFEGEIEEVEYVPKRHVLSVRFGTDDMIRISRGARRLGMDQSTFVRMLVKQSLRGHADELLEDR